jgi:magnesium transporter
MTSRQVRVDVEALIDERRWSDLKAAVVEWPAPELAQLVLERETPDRLILFRVLTRNLSGEVFSHLDSEAQNSLLGELNEIEISKLLSNLEPDDRTHLFEELPDRVVQRMLTLLTPEELKSARLLLSYPDESVGRLMTPEYVAIRRDWTIEHALRHIRVKGRDREVVSTIYVTDDHWKFLDAVNLPKLILAELEDKVESVLQIEEAVTLAPYDDREEAVRKMGKYDLFVLPVVGSDGVLLGIVTADDVLDVAQEEATEDFQLSAAVEPLKTTYRDSTALSLVRKRVPWLLALVVFNLGAAGVIAAYEETLNAVLALAFFLPLIMGSAGNTGAQSATLFVRALATGEFDRGRWMPTLLKEIVVGALLGAMMGIAAWILGIIGVVAGTPQIAASLGLAMFLVVLVSNMIGVAIPMLLTRVGIDPAVASSPLITSIADVAGLLIYFAIASQVLGTVTNGG